MFLSDPTLTTLKAIWVGPSSNFDNYLVVVSPAGAAPVQEITFGSTTNSAVLENLQPGTEYRVQIFVTVGESKLRSDPLEETEFTSECELETQKQKYIVK